MAASYQTGVPSSPTDLLQKLVTWLVAQGWTQNMSQAEGTGWRAHLSKAGIYVNLRATPGNEALWQSGTYFGNTNQIGIGLYTGTGYSGASAWYAQAGGPVGTYTLGVFMQTPVGAMTKYHFFDDGSDNIVVVVERTSGIFTHMGWGPSLTKVGAWTGGAYFFGALSGYFGSLTSPFPGTASYSAATPGTHTDAQGGASTFVRADVDSFTGKWIGVISAVSPNYGYTGKLGASPIYLGTVLPADIPQYGTFFQGRMVSALNSQANLLPVRLYVQRDAGGYSLLGDIPNVFFSNATANGFAESTIYQLGADNYMVFDNFAVLKKA